MTTVNCELCFKNQDKNFVNDQPSPLLEPATQRDLDEHPIIPPHTYAPFLKVDLLASPPHFIQQVKQTVQQEVKTPAICQCGARVKMSGLGTFPMQLGCQLRRRAVWLEREHAVTGQSNCLKPAIKRLFLPLLLSPI